MSHNYSAPAMASYETVPTLCVKANMGIGKTVQLVEYIKKLDDKANIVIISFRRTFTSEILRRFPAFVSYFNTKGIIKLSEHPKVVVQVESLHRIVLDVPLTLMVLDESESNLSQFSSGLNAHVLFAFDIFKHMLQSAQHVIAMDANLSDRTTRVLKMLRGGEYFIHNNIYKNKSDHVCRIIRSSIAFEKKLLDDVKSGNKIALALNVKNMAIKYSEKIRLSYPDKKVLLITGDTPQKEKDRIYSDVNKTLIEYDIVIYTPTMTAGVSFEQDHFDKLYGYFIAETCDGYTCDQMMGRIRNLRKKEYVIYLRNGHEKPLPITVDDIRTSAESADEWPVVVTTEGYDDVDDEPINDIDSDYISLWLETRLVKNMFRNNFTSSMTEIFRQKGYIII
jgi:hypothetical protein